jgi:AcrR family transcriptional regulator
MTTKQKIIASSIKLFNQNGLTNVRLQQIADDVGISVGNLAYHYYSKEAIVNEIDRQLSELILPVINAKRSFPYLMDLDTQLAHYYHLLMNYPFYFLDLLEIKRKYPKLYKKRKQYISQIILQIETWFQINTQNGILLPETRPRHYKIIAHTIWMIITFYMTQPIDHGKPEDSERVFKEMVWCQVLPYFTEAGRMEFDILIERLLDSFTPKEKMEEEENIITAHEKNETKDNPIIH